jgi:HSP20 family protein
MAQGQLVPLGVGAQGFDPFAVLRKQVEQLFDGVTRGGAIQERDAATVMPPRINVSEDDREIKISAEMPGVRPQDLTVTVADDMLTIRGEHEQERETDRKNYHVVERRIGVFQRSLRLPFPVDPNQVRASVDHGVLNISIAKTDPKQRSHRIEVSSSGKDGESDTTKAGGDRSSKDANASSEEKGPAH